MAEVNGPNSMSRPKPKRQVGAGTIPSSGEVAGGRNLGDFLSSEPPLSADDRTERPSAAGRNKER